MQEKRTGRANLLGTVRYREGRTVGGGVGRTVFSFEDLLRRHGVLKFVDGQGVKEGWGMGESCEAGDGADRGLYTSRLSLYFREWFTTPPNVDHRHRSRPDWRGRRTPAISARWTDTDHVCLPPTPLSSNRLWSDVFCHRARPSRSRTGKPWGGHVERLS